MTAQILDGKAIAQKVRDEVRRGVEEFVAQRGRAPGLDVILVGDDAASQVYTRNKEKASNEVGMRGNLHALPARTTEDGLLGLVAELNRDHKVDGILVQLPLPKSISDQRVLDAIDPAKDVDGFHPMNIGKLASGRPTLASCTPRGCMRLLEETGVPLEGLHAVVVGRSNIVGKPMAQLLLGANLTVTIAHSKTRDLVGVCQMGDIVIAAVGRARTIRAEHVREGAIVIDVGINRRFDGKLEGDVDFEPVKEKAAWITPVPGGVGPMTIACLLENTLAAARARANVNGR